ncbi:hypothetical protein TNCV_2195331 [Trichonephila clavipes]|uniref:Uncharacterized protein n=1 Tax=Trichonephila clavipes TaxID=2585209 RepID=A0A8X6SB42_TRICX|nr:hypothetical protein TNCV_2195331 [Trichonephila clavipes]
MPSSFSVIRVEAILDPSPSTQRPKSNAMNNHSTHLVEIEPSVESACALVFEIESRAHLFVSNYHLNEYLTIDAVTFPPYSCEAVSLWTATAGSDVVQSGRPIFDDFFQHLWPYIGNNTANVVFQMVKRLWLIRIDQ